MYLVCSTGIVSAVPPIASIKAAVHFLSAMPTLDATFLPAGVTCAFLDLALLVVEDLRLQHLAEAHAVPVWRDVDVEVALDMLPHNLGPLPHVSDICNAADVA